MQTQELLNQFVQEARECLEQVGDILLQVERDPQNMALLNNLFRLVHTLKGNCGLFDFRPLEMVVHAGEDLLDQVRSGGLTYGDAMADALLQAMDFTASLVDEIERSGAIDEEALERATYVAMGLRSLLASADAPQAAVSEIAATVSDTEAEAPSWLKDVPVHWREHHGAVIWRYVPEPECFFKGEDPCLYARQSLGLLDIRIRPLQPWPQDLSQWDCYICNLEILALSTASLEEIQTHFRYIPEQISIYQMQAAAAAQPDAVNALDIPAAMQQAANRLWQEQMAVLAVPTVKAGSVLAVRRVFTSILRALGHTEGVPAWSSLQGLPESVSAQALLQWAQAHASDQVTEADVATADTMVMAPATQAVPAKTAVHEEHAHSKQLKVSQEKVDRLMDLIGEMVVAKNALPYLAQRAEDVFQQRELAREIKAQYAVINRIAEDMQHAIMQVRMLPVGAVFQRFGRLVRDISKKLGKEVQLVIEGEETEADKNVIEALADPLIHILRNSLDHGIEMPEVRVQAGKPACGTIRVRAHQESDRVVIEISDDGAGVHAQRVRDKAVERGLIPADKAQQLSDVEAAQLIFLPGFSTADKVSDLSGRGVGMDVVRSAVERINGQVELSSTQGQGTLLRLSLPLSMAVTNVMIIEAAGRRFGVPMDWIVETVRVHTDDIHQFKQTQTTVLRGRIVPLRALHDLLTLEQGPQCNEDHEYAVLVVRIGNEHLGLLVDQFHGATDIILKPLEGILSGLCGFAGTALMGDGSVLMVLNPKELY